MKATLVVVKNNLENVQQSLRNQSMVTARTAALMAETGMKKDLASSKHGRSYKRGENGIHVASAPGEPPAVDYGYLINSIGTDELENGAAVYASSDHAEVMEFGGAKSLPRPFFQKNAMAVQQWFIGQMAKLLR